MQNRFSIGEMAKLHNTTIKALRYYDEIDLLKPIHTDGNNGYRYYSTEQFEHLNTIHYLKELGFSLKEIKGHLDYRDIDSFLSLLEEQKRLTEDKIKELKGVKQRFQNRINDIKLARESKELGIPFIKMKEERRIVRLMEKISSEPELEVSLRRLESQSNKSSSIFIGGVGLTVSINNLVNNKFNEYNSIFILAEEDDIQGPLVATLSEGKYVCIYYNGNHNDSPEHYRSLLNFIRDNGFEVSGDSIERTIIDHYISRRKEDYLTEIQVPIKC
ncbi:MerR family transcriptional regulator [Metabacillus litoralis]|uniref:MerR family transcriptional regulator n=2 Tax=Metabacillus TaxID=2675233 RepID=UPI000EF6216B|nr:MerR family transcriptional regulator [Metabacillus litoralis]MCM3164247.1 MerR family transcriptional regulator [Metabacillus litoralis]MCM3413675.1 MerR family transcriptional regulator [Metabacillus litoralis]UHA58547.1 MerR family transcriptional regulator [Metabacillus litoralis]